MSDVDYTDTLSDMDDNDMQYRAAPEFFIKWMRRISRVRVSDAGVALNAGGMYVPKHVKWIRCDSPVFDPMFIQSSGRVELMTAASAAEMISRAPGLTMTPLSPAGRQIKSKQSIWMTTSTYSLPRDNWGIRFFITDEVKTLTSWDSFPLIMDFRSAAARSSMRRAIAAMYGASFNRWTVDRLPK